MKTNLIILSSLLVASLGANIHLFRENASKDLRISELYHLSDAKEAHITNLSNRLLELTDNPQNTSTTCVRPAPTNIMEAIQFDAQRSLYGC